MNIQENQIIGELVAKDYRTAAVFKKYNIDFCCQGNRTISEACEKKKLDVNPILTDLDNSLLEKEEGSIDFKTWPLDLLTDYIEKKHHRYVETQIGVIRPYLNKICSVHGERHPELFRIQEEFNTSTGELVKHMKKEELILFPYIRKMVTTNPSEKALETPHFGTVQNPIEMMMSEHTVEGERFRVISELSNDYTPPEDACNTYRVTFALIQEFEQDLHLHIHLENNILFPKAIELEKTLRV